MNGTILHLSPRGMRRLWARNRKTPLAMLTQEQLQASIEAGRRAIEELSERNRAEARARRANRTPAIE